MSDAPTSPAARDDRDLYCLQCGYNLRGLSGDPRRCPECGHMNPMGDIELPADLITAQLRRMEGAPSACVGLTAVWLLIGVLPSAVYLLESTRSGRNLDPRPLTCSIAVTLMTGFSWIYAAVKFRGYCEGANGWKRALLLYHLYGLALVGGVVAPILTTKVITFSKPGPREETLILTGLATAIAVIAVGGRLVRRKMKAVLDPMQREVAVKLAREGLRRRLDQGTEWWQLPRKG